MTDREVSDYWDLYDKGTPRQFVLQAMKVLRMAWGLLDRFRRPRWLLERILLVADHVATSDEAVLPALLIDVLREHLGAQHVCIHFADPGMLPPDARETLAAACPAATDNATGAVEIESAEAQFWQYALESGKTVTASTTPPPLQAELRPVLDAAGVRDCIAIPLVYRGEVYAVVNLYSKRRVPTELAAENDDLRSIRLIGNLVYGALLQQYHKDVLQQADSVVLAMAQAVATRDGYADGHVARVCEFALALGDAAGLNSTELQAARKAAMLRDIGKLHVPDYVLQKPGPLDTTERACVREHPVLGARMLLTAGAGPETAGEMLSMVASAVRSHHERLDGSGYPDGLVGSDVPLLARIVAIADVYAALVADRPYRAALPVPRAVHVLQELAGCALDPELVSLFLASDIHASTAFRSPREAEQVPVKQTS